ncbi:AKAP7 2'5' RNA ligase-like domain-containing protein [Chloropicon primus]|nr:AKAP7 2'5' RNA ligase-like domain-containing protein [Chloropicon primus]
MIPYRVVSVGARRYRSHECGITAPNAKSGGGGGAKGGTRAPAAGGGGGEGCESHSEEHQVSPALHRYVAGKQGISPQLAQLAQVQVLGDRVTLKGSQEGVSAASALLQSYVAAGAQRDATTPLTHFLCISLATPEVKNTYEAFQSKHGGYDRKLFARSSRLHLTLSMLKLYSSEQLDEAKKVLQSFQGTASGPIPVDMKGLALMKGSPEKARVLYAQVSGDQVDKLQGLCDGVKKAFAEAGMFVSNPESGVKLHCTLMNTRWSKGRIKHFDAGAVLEQDENLSLGSIEVKDVKLVSFTKIGQDDFYAVLDSVTI